LPTIGAKVARQQDQGSFVLNISGMAAVVTGGASGLGAGTVDLLAARGAKVTVFDLDPELGAAKARQVDGHFVRVNVSDEPAVEAALAEAESVNGPARVLVNCAGVGAPARVLGRDGGALPLDEFGQIITINLLGTFNVLSKFAARLAVCEPITDDGERGVIINTASIAAFDGQTGQAAYAASKGGLVSMTLPIARELARHGIRVNTIAPGIFITPALASLPQETQDSLGRQIPFPSRLGQPHEFAHLVEAIVVNSMLNGEVIRLDGAIRMAAK
jgi:NAD(P)-dependent dehydrogenase (short-subunit alcohol dehydrogenase family)